MKTRHFFWTLPRHLPQKRTCMFYIQDRYFPEMRSIHIYVALLGGGGEAIVSEAKRRAQHMIIITCTRLACCTCKTELAGRTPARAADSTVIVLECIVGGEGASKLGESAVHRGLTKVLRILCQPRTNIFSRNKLGQNPPPPNDAFSFLPKYR